MSGPSRPSDSFALHDICFGLLIVGGILGFLGCLAAGQPTAAVCCVILLVLAVIGTIITDIAYRLRILSENRFRRYEDDERARESRQPPQPPPCG